MTALDRFAQQMANAVDTGRLNREQAGSAIAQVIFDHVGRSDLTHPDTRRRNVRRVRTALGRKP